MSIASEITRLQLAKADIKTAIENKGVTVADNVKLDSYAGLVDNIELGGEETIYAAFISSNSIPVAGSIDNTKIGLIGSSHYVDIDEGSKVKVYLIMHPNADILKVTVEDASDSSIYLDAEDFSLYDTSTNCKTYVSSEILTYAQTGGATCYNIKYNNNIIAYFYAVSLD